MLQDSIERINGINPNETNILLGGEDRVIIIGDIHEHYLALKELVTLTEARYKSGINRYVFIGDYLDKGGNTKDTIDLIWTLIHANGAKMVMANHESYIVKRLTGELRPNLDLEKKSFSSLEFLTKPENKEYADKVIDIWNLSIPFLKVIRQDDKAVYATHAPCPESVLGGYSDAAQKDQRNLRRFMKDDAREHYQFIFDEADDRNPIHVFGHVAHKAEIINFKNKWFLDTGAVYGGYLSAFVVESKGQHLIQVPCETLFEYEEKSLRTDAVTPPVFEFNVKDEL